jgi:hypothetical protein
LSFNLNFRGTEYNSEYIRSELYSSQPNPKGYIENIVRLRKANEQKKKMCEIIATQGMTKNYTGQVTKPQPFNLETNSKKKKGPPCVIIEVTIAPGKTGVLGIHKDDDPRQLAANFAKIYNLSVESEDMLFNIILENMMSDAFKSLKNSDIAPILEAKEQEEQTSGQINQNSNGSYGGQYNDNSKNSYRTNASKSKIQTTNFNTQQVKQFAHEYNEESMNSFNKNNEDMFEKSGYDE